ncbi:MAG: VWA domain-containing protein [Gemmataceae bacterium]
MSRAVEYLSTNWLAAFLVVLALLLLVILSTTGYSRKRNAFGWLTFAACTGLLGVGGLILSADWAVWVGLGTVLVFFGMVAVLLLTTRWWTLLAWITLAIGLLSLGGMGSAKIGEFLTDTGRRLLSLRPVQPWWLLLVLLLPLLVWISFRSLTGLGPIRRWVILGLRCLLVTLVILALAEMRLQHESDTVTVLFVVDRSLSVPEEWESDVKAPGGKADQRWDRIKKFINDCVEKRGPDHKNDKAGIIVFGRQPRLELPPANVPTLNFNEVASPIDGNYTDIAAALKLALASFPEGSAKRVVLISDGNENLGDALEQARLAKLNHVQIDVVPLAAGLHNENEVLVEGVSAPAQIEQGAQLSVTVRIRSFNPNIVVGRLIVRQICEGVATELVNIPEQKLIPGLNSLPFKHSVTNQEKSYTYEAEFQPKEVRTERGEVLVRGLPGSRPQNKRASTHVVARGQRRILLVEQKEGDHGFLLDQLLAAANGKVRIDAIVAASLPKDKDKLGILLSNFDSILLANLPAEALSEEQQEMIRSNTYDQGCGLVMIGGPESYGAGGWQGTAVEKALPVDSEIKSLKVEGKGGLVLIMHASEMAQGNFWQKKIAKLAIEKLGPHDEVGILHFDWGAMKWHIGLQEIGDQRSGLMAQVDSLMPGDMPDFDPGLKMAHKALIDPDRGLASKHVIVISDGDPVQSDPAILPRMKRDGVTVSTVGVATHGAALDQALARIARATGGRPYLPKNANELPAIYTKETRLVSQSFLYENKKGFRPALLYRTGPTEKLSELPPLFGFVRTTPKSSPSVDVSIKSPVFADQDYPILAYWHYGLGKAVAFTSDACEHLLPENKRIYWAADWARSQMYTKFWEQVIDWSLRAVESKRLTMTSQYRDGKVKVTVEARDQNNQPIIDLNLRGGVTAPNFKTNKENAQTVRFRQTNSGSYEAEFKAEEAGSYFINAQATRLVKKMKDGKPALDKDGKEIVIEEGFDGVRAGVTIPYSQEFAVMESNTQLLEALCRETGGNNYADNATDLAEAASSHEVFRGGLDPFRSSQPIWQWLLFFAGIVLFLDVAARRIAIEPSWVAAKAQKTWNHLRGRTVAVEQVPQFLERLRSRKVEVEEKLAKTKAAVRFDSGEKHAATPPGVGDMPQSTPLRTAPSGPKPGLAPEASQESEDYASRLLKAKKRIWKDQQKDR